MNLLGRTVQWKSGKREDSETSWGEALRHHWLDTCVATAWGTTLYALNPKYFFWVLPVIGALVLSVPISVLASRVRIGDRVRRAGLFVIPEESNPPPELRDLAFPFDDPPKELRGASLNVTFWVRNDGRVDRYEVMPEISDRDYARKFDEVIRAFRFTPARAPDGTRIAGTTRVTFTLPGKRSS